MTTTIKQRIAQAKQVAIPDYLARLGIRPTKPTRGGWLRYHSPLRDKDKDESFNVDPIGTKWKDHAENLSGDIIDLAKLLSNSNDLETALRHIEDTMTNSFLLGDNCLKGESFVHMLPDKSKTGEVYEVMHLSDKNLIRYLQLRCIEFDIAQKYCREIVYKLNDAQKYAYHSIAFANDSQGYELRTEYINKDGKKAKIKRTIGTKDITTLTHDHHGKKSTVCVVFEGFFDLLSFLQLAKDKGHSYSYDYCVLNSTSQVQKAVQFLQDYQQVITCLDNDHAGRTATEAIRQALPRCQVIDASPRYKLNDVNEYLCALRMLQAYREHCKKYEKAIPRKLSHTRVINQ